MDRCAPSATLGSQPELETHKARVPYSRRALSSASVLDSLECLDFFTVLELVFSLLTEPRTGRGIGDFGVLNFLGAEANGGTAVLEGASGRRSGCKHAITE